MIETPTSEAPAPQASLSLRRRWVLPALAGIASVAFGLGVAEIAAAIVAPTGSPIVVVGSLLIDLAPSWAKETAIALFGTADKAALLIGIGIVLLVLAAAIGVLESIRRSAGRVVIGLATVFALIAAMTRSGAAALDAVPATVAGVGAAIALGFLLRKAPRPDATPRSRELDRRSFLRWTGAATAVGALTAVVGSALQAGARVATNVRETLVLPAPATTAAPLPAGADLGIEGLSPIVTTNAQFYRIDTALQIPRVNPEDWELRITGMVDEEVTLTWAELIALPLEESVTTLMCVSNEVGGTLIGTARWLGYPIRTILERAKPQAGADMVLSRSIDGFTAGTPLSVLQEEDRDAIFAVGMNGEPLPEEHGFPVRMVVPGLYGYVSATKWVVSLEVTTFERSSAYWTDRGWGEKGPIKTESRIEVARDGVIAGTAWHQHLGIEKVEVRVDDGAWTDAELSTPISIDTWVQWKLDWSPRPGQHTIQVRATNADGTTQTSDVADVLPDGATGWHTVSVTI